MSLHRHLCRICNALWDCDDTDCELADKTFCTDCMDAIQSAEDEKGLMVARLTPAIWYVRLNVADLWHLAPSPGIVAALCGHPPTAKGWPDATAERPERIHCAWCARAQQKAALKGAPR